MMTLTKCSVCGKDFNEDLEWLGMCIDCQMESDANAMQEMNQEEIKLKLKKEV